MDKLNRPARRLRCAIYTRKSSEEGLDMEFNSLDAQREACEAYVASQKAEGWAAIRERYDDGGFSGGTLDRPALKQLLSDIEDGLIDVIVVYKIDRLSRSLMDFAKLVEVFDRNNVTFVSVTQSFNTTTSMGRLTLNILLSFAQFEREVIGERIRDKFAASRKRGMWMGGSVPMGYDVRDRKLVVNEAEAETVRRIFGRFVELGSATELARELRREGTRNKQGTVIDKGYLYRLLNNRVYRGEAVHKGNVYEGEHDAIIDDVLWERAHAILGYSYYVSMDVIRNRETGYETAPRRLAAGMVESAVVGEVRRILQTPEIIRHVAAALKDEGTAAPEAAARAAVRDFETLWSKLFPAEQARIIQLLVQRVTVTTSGLEVDLRKEGIAGVIREIITPPRLEAAE